MDENFDDCGGFALALLESKLAHDSEAFNILTDTIAPAQIVWSAATLAAFMAQRAAVGFTVADTGEQVSDDPDNGLWRIFTIATVAEALVPDDEVINVVSNVYRARDCFLRSMRDSVADTGPDEDGNVVVSVVFWDGWEDENSFEVIIGVGMALERLFMLDMATEPSETMTEFDESKRSALVVYRRFVAGG